MPEDDKKNLSPEEQVTAAREAFEQEFERFSRFRGGVDKTGATLKEAETLQRELNDLRARQTGKKSALASVKKLIGRVAPEARASFGQRVQQLESEISGLIDEVEVALREFTLAAKVERERIDVTLPGRRPRRGHLHPITLLRQQIEDVFVALGYAVEDDREIETEFYNFDALNIPESHPVRHPADTFYTTNGIAVKPQTSTVQLHDIQRRG